MVIRQCEKQPFLGPHNLSSEGGNGIAKRDCSFQGHCGQKIRNWPFPQVAGRQVSSQEEMTVLSWGRAFFFLSFRDWVRGLHDLPILPVHVFMAELYLCCFHYVPVPLPFQRCWYGEHDPAT